MFVVILDVLAETFVFNVAILFVFVVILDVCDETVVGKVAIVEEFIPPTLFTVVAKLPVPLPVTSPVKVIVWSPVLDPLNVEIPNFVFMVAIVSSPVLMPDVFDKTPDFCASVT